MCQTLCEAVEIKEYNIVSTFKKLTRFQLNNQRLLIKIKRESTVHGGDKRGCRCNGNSNVGFGVKLRLSLCHL